MISRQQAIELDESDALADFRDRFVITDPDLIYLDGNSLGRLPKATVDRVRATMAEEWGDGLVRSWRSGWMAEPGSVGARLAPLIGADPDEVLLTDQTSLNLYKLASAALAHQAPRSTVLTDSGNFPSDIYVLSGVAGAAGGSVRMVGADPVAPSTSAIEAALDDQVGLVSLSHVNFKSGALLDMSSITTAAHEAGAMVLWDLSHSVGAVPIDLRGSGVDLAVGCTYKYLNGGPGSPAFLYVARHLQDTLVQPIHGWWGQEDMFGFGLKYQPAPGMDRFATGTMPILSLAGAGVGIDLTAEAGIDRIRSKSVALTSLIVDLFDELPAGYGFSLGSPRDDGVRGSHVSLRHPDGYRITQALIERNVIPDFRAPDVVRLGAAALYTRFVDVWDAFERLREIMESGAHEEFTDERSGVT
ncbi:MAG: kynureninase [Acidimicrobiia bacterium]|nr:kynureninase [Acidimicrobiia bacterium]